MWGIVPACGEQAAPAVFARDRLKAGEESMTDSSIQGGQQADKQADKPNLGQAPRAERPSIFRALMRIYPFVQGAVPRLALGGVAALCAAVVALSIPLALGWMVDGPLASGDTSQILPTAAVILGLGVAEAIFVFLRRALVLGPGTLVDGKMRNAIYVHLQKLPVAFHDKWQSGQLLSRAMGDVSTVRRWLSFGIVMLAVNGITILIGFTMLFVFNPLLGAVFTLFSLPLFFFSARFQRKLEKLSRRAQDQQGDLATIVEESVHGIRILKAFGRETHALKGLTAQASAVRTTELLKGRTMAGMWFWLLFIPDTAFAVSLVLGIALASTGSVTVGTLFAFFATATILRGPIQSIGFLLSLTIDARNALDRFFDVLDTPVSILDADNAADLAAGQGSLVFDDVHFRYEDAAEETPAILRGVTLEIRPGETMALVGLTGSGKTTLTALTTRLFDVTSGRILIDGTDIRDVTAESLRTRVAMAFEDATLFSLPVRENVLLGRADLITGEPDATGTAPEVSHSGPEAEAVLNQALDVAQAGFARDLPRGLDTTIGEEGLSLSGGQRQRLALARAIAVAPSILVLDDPLSALDVTTEAMVEEALRRVLATTTALIVAHRPSTVALADRVALLHEGRIDDVGTHAELMKRSATYRHVMSSLDDEARERTNTGSIKTVELGREYRSLTRDEEEGL
ncbi:MAG: ATP-binding cassette subfamily B protein [Alpinimonas sp.]|jgi:ATP-binding cassette subfamily B protein